MEWLRKIHMKHNVLWLNLVTEKVLVRFTNLSEVFKIQESLLFVISNAWRTSEIGCSCRRDVDFLFTPCLSLID